MQDPKPDYSKLVTFTKNTYDPTQENPIAPLVGTPSYTIPHEIKMLIKKRQLLRLAKNWEESDRIRLEIERRTGKKLVDSKNGSLLV